MGLFFGQGLQSDECLMFAKVCCLGPVYYVGHPGKGMEHGSILSSSIVYDG